jgi:thiol-disulfide isomerase/thioredoxin
MGIQKPRSFSSMILFLTLASSIQIQLTNENFTSFIANATKPLFLKMWATWCPHCREFAPVWEALANSTEVHDDVYIADIECESNRATCQAYGSGRNYPRLYWVDLENRTAVPYTGSRTLDHFVGFVRKQLRYPMVLVNATELVSEIESAHVSTIFLFRIPESDGAGLTVARDVTATFRSLESRFLVQTESVTARTLTAFTTGNRSAVYTGEWAHDNISEFVFLRSIPFFTEMNSFVLGHLSDYGLTAFIETTAGEVELSGPAVAIGERVAEYFPVVQANCTEFPFFCRYVGIGVNPPTPVFVIFHPARRLFWISEAGANEEAIVAWALKVKSGAVRPRGPGDGLFGWALEIYFQQRAHNRPIALLCVGPIIVLIALGFLIADCSGVVDSVKAKAD